MALKNNDNPSSNYQFAHAPPVSEAIKNRKFWILSGTIFLVSIPVIGVTTNLVPMMLDRNLSLSSAAWLASLIGAAVLIGRLVTGWLIDRLWPPGVACVIVMLAACGSIILALSEGNVAYIAVALFLIGLAQGAELDLLAFLTARYFDRLFFATIFGLANIAFFASLPVGAVGFALCFDLTGDYAFALWLSAGLFIMAAGLFLVIEK